MSGIQRPVWRRGIYRLIAVDTPEVGHNVRIVVPTVPEGIWWRVKSLRYRLATSAAAGNRTVRTVVGTDSGSDPNALFNSAYSFFIAGIGSLPANNTNDFLFSELGQGAAVGSIDYGIIPFEVVVQPGHVIGTAIPNLDVADQISNVLLLVQEMIYVPPVDVITGEIQAATARIIAAVAEAGKSKCALIGGQEQVGAPTP